jgi:lipoprotein-anchoring transpeptidase ErfK/SrfK
VATLIFISCCLLFGLLVHTQASSAATQFKLATQSPNPALSTASSPNVVARARGTIVSIYESPTSPKPLTVLRSPTSSDSPLVFLVSDLSQWPNWLRVYLPSRPNQSEGWIRTDAVTLSSDDYLVQVHLDAHTLSVSNGGKVILSAAISVGRSVLPTPQGTYFIVDLLKQPTPDGEYGPFAFGLSAYSDVLYSFGGGPGEIGLHGTNEPNSIGTNASHGCIRVPDATIMKLARLLPLGTRVVISS